MMKREVELKVGDLHATGMVVTETNLPVGFGTITLEDTDTLVVNEREMWLQNDQDDLLCVNDASMFYADFPPLPDFPCMSSSSSSSPSTPAPAVKATTITSSSSSSSSSSASSSSAASWAVLKSDVEEDVEKINNNCHRYYMQQQHHHHDPVLVDAAAPPAPALSSTASMEVSQQTPDPILDICVGDCMDVMDTFGYLELLESNDFFDPASIFQNGENPLLEEFPQDHQAAPQQEEEHAMVVPQQHQKELEEDRVIVCANGNNEEEIQGDQGAGAGADDEMSTVFLEWLKSNKDSVSANDLRSVKLKKATIECAARRLGGGKEAMKQLLKLILEWVQTSHLQNKRRKENDTNTPSNLLTQIQDPGQNQNQNTNTTSSNLNPSSFGPESNTCFNQSPNWISQSYGTDQAASLIPQPMLGGYVVGDPYTNGAAASNNINGTTQYNPYPPATDQYHHMLESAHSWPPSQFAVASSYCNQSSFGDNNSLHPAVPFGCYGNQYPYQFFHGPGDRLMRLGPSATKEARKKRMARQRRYSSHHRVHHGHNHDQNQGGVGSDNCTAVLAAAHANPANWVYWQAMPGGGAASMAPVVPAELPGGQQVAMQTQNYHQGRVSSERRQGWKPEKNLRFLLQKVLKQSDVGSLGRIVLPKKEAETHLPELEARDGISITMEDIGTSRVWNMRYRYWPNNKSRMYLLENTGDFVRANGLQEGDFIVIYSDVKCGKYMIRGVKVRQQGAKPETKKAGKSQKNQHGNNAATTAGAGANNGTPSSPQQKNEKAVK